ncbi:MAG TPA: MMPL family transporter, partial [Parvularculaceae bacterium]|nr:MMPL family transporter [Parvularculaceae bacterium]
MNPIVEASMKRPSALMWFAGLFSLVMIALVAAPTLAPRALPFLHALKIDTDPENMLAAEEPVRVYHNAMKKEFGLNDLVVVGVIDNAHENGVFNAKTLSDVYALAEFAKTLRWEEDGETKGVIGVDLIAPSTVDSIDQAGLGSVSFSWLMPAAPETDEEALAVREKAQKIPTLNDTLVSGDGKAIALYVPITSKDLSYKVASALKKKIATFDDGATYHITGLPIAQDQFGFEMFKQMAISAPAAMALIFFLMWLFFRRLALITSPMIVAMVSVIGAMGALVITGNTVHIMSSMIPIFVMPIAVLDAVHILSDFYDRYPVYRDKRETMRHVM